MTLLVGMVGLDGIVLAADQILATFAKDESQVDNFIYSTKLQLFEDQKLLCGYVGDEWALYIGEEISQNIKPGLRSGEVASFLKSCAESGIRRAYGSVQNRRSIDNATREVLVAIYRGDDEPSLWHIKIKSWEDLVAVEDRHLTKVMPISGQAILGATGNTARYFGHYFRQDMPVETLRRIAAQIVFAGNEVDGSMIDGLDIAVVYGGSCRFATKGEKRQLRETSREIDEFIRTRLSAQKF